MYLKIATLAVVTALTSVACGGSNQPANDASSTSSEAGGSTGSPDMSTSTGAAAGSASTTENPMAGGTSSQ